MHKSILILNHPLGNKYSLDCPLKHFETTLVFQKRLLLQFPNLLSVKSFNNFRLCRAKLGLPR